MKELAVYLMLHLGGNANPTQEDVRTALRAAGIEANQESLDKLFRDVATKDLNELIALGKQQLVTFGSHGGNGNVDPAKTGSKTDEQNDPPEEPDDPLDVPDIPIPNLFGDGPNGGDY